jgi:GDPmannose 4,6-dehydratase
MKKRAFITGIAGQDGSYLAELLLSKDYEVYGLVRSSTTNVEHENIKHILSSLKIEVGDVSDFSRMSSLIKTIKPHEIYNLAAQSHVGHSFELPNQTSIITGQAIVGILEAIRLSGFNSKLYQASTSEMFGNSADGLRKNEKTPFVPASPYGCAKLYAHSMVNVYRSSYNMFACSGILFNHESPRRGPDFVTQKIVKGVCALKNNCEQTLTLGNLSASRDWGHARDYVEGMWMMLQTAVPEDFVLATGETHTVAEFLEAVLDEYDAHEIRHKIVINSALYRPTDVNILIGDASYAYEKLGWKHKTSFRQLVKEMCDAEKWKYEI